MGRKPALSSCSPQRIAHALRPSESQKPNMSVPYPARPRLPRSKERVPKKCKEQRREEELDCLGPPPRSRCGHSGSPHEVLRQTTLPVHCRLLAPRPSRGQNAICEERARRTGGSRGPAHAVPPALRPSRHPSAPRCGTRRASGGPTAFTRTLSCATGRTGHLSAPLSSSTRQAAPSALGGGVRPQHTRVCSCCTINGSHYLNFSTSSFVSL